METLLTREVCSQFKGKVQKKIQKVGLFKALLLAMKKVAAEVISFPICILIRLIKPLIFIRIGSLNGEKIGPFASQPELYLCEKDNGIQPKNTWDMFFSDKNSYACNHQLLTMWKRVLRVFEPSKHLCKMMGRLLFGQEHIIRTTSGSRDLHGLLEKSNIHLKFLPEEITQAKLELSRMGISEGDKYILMINRGQRYLDQIFPGQEWGYHTHRNCSIEKFMLMAESLVAKGYFVIRAGHFVSDLMNTENPKIIEYDHKGFRTELLDIYLGANCRFIVGSDTGYFAVPGWIFHRPAVWINFTQLEYISPWLSNWLFIFRKYWLKSEKRFMRVREMIESGAGRFKRNEEFNRMGIEAVENTPEEILDAASEMEQRLDGIWQPSDEDEELQKRFWSYFESSNLQGVIRSRIGAKYLRQNKDLLL